jgi:phthalate 4,5-dioxygenase
MYNAIEEVADDGTDRPGYPSIKTSGRVKRFGRVPRLEVHEDWYGFRYAGLRKTPNNHDHVRVSTWIMPYGMQIPAIPFSTRQLLVVPIDDYSAWRYLYTTRPLGYDNPRNVSEIAESSGRLMAQSRAVPGNPFTRSPNREGVQERMYTAENEYGIDRAVQKDKGPKGTYSGIPDGSSQDYMVTESMGPIYDRTKEHLGTTDIAIVRMHTILLRAAKDLAEGKEPPAVSADHDYRNIRSAEKILEPGEDWRILGTNNDPIVAEAEALRL